MAYKEDCNEKMAEYMLRRYHRRREEALRHLGGKCVVCGTTENLEIDHIAPALKSFTLSKLWSVAISQFKQELEKCQLLCKKHHLDKSRREGSLNKSWVTKPRLVHGSKWTYKHHKCRCEICVAAHGPRIPDRGPRKHGERRTYVRGCRCTGSKKANAGYMRHLRAKNKGR